MGNRPSQSERQMEAYEPPAPIACETCGRDIPREVCFTAWQTRDGRKFNVCSTECGQAKEAS